MDHENKSRRGRPSLHPGVEPYTFAFKFKDHPNLIDDLDRAIADLAEDGIKASKSDIFRALILAQRDHLVDITREYLGYD